MASNFREYLESLSSAQLQEEKQIAEGTLQLINEVIKEREE